MVVGGGRIIVKTRGEGAEQEAQASWGGGGEEEGERGRSPVACSLAKNVFVFETARNASMYKHGCSEKVHRGKPEFVKADKQNGTCVTILRGNSTRLTVCHTDLMTDYNKLQHRRDTQ